jgi:hypothetical protein
VTVAALYVDPNGVYAGLEDVDLWDEERDARLYDGPWPVVAHPPCQRWCMFAKGIETRFGYRVGDDDGCFEAALDAVREFGGVLEHPAHTLAWVEYELPEPSTVAGWTTAIGVPGAVAYVEQGRYGLPVRKATWLYACGVTLPELRWGFNSGMGEYKWHQRRDKLNDPRDDPRPRMRGELSAHTPPMFRDVLLDMARSAVGCSPAHQQKENS